MSCKRKIRRHGVVVNTTLTKTDKWPSLCERHFWIFAFGVILISILTCVFDFSLKPPSYKGLFITRPYYGLHSWGSANRAWNARSHVKYGLGYTKGYRTLVVGDPPPDHPQRYVSHPSLETLINAFGMLLLGSQEWQVRLFDLILSALTLLLILYLLRKLYGCGCALLSGLLLVIFNHISLFPLRLIDSPCWSLGNAGVLIASATFFQIPLMIFLSPVEFCGRK